METKNISIENAKTMFRNFQGKQTQYNPAGKRNFCVEIPEEILQDLLDDGWNVRYTRPRDESVPPTPYIQVAVSFDNIPPTVWMITNGKKVAMDEDSIGMLDWSDILNVDLIIRPYNWEVNGKSGVKAYLKTMYVTVDTDDFASKYNFEDKEETPF